MPESRFDPKKIILLYKGYSFAPDIEEDQHSKNVDRLNGAYNWEQVDSGVYKWLVGESRSVGIVKKIMILSMYCGEIVQVDYDRQLFVSRLGDYEQVIDGCGLFGNGRLTMRLPSAKSGIPWFNPKGPTTSVAWHTLDGATKDEELLFNLVRLRYRGGNIDVGSEWYRRMVGEVPILGKSIVQELLEECQDHYNPIDVVVRLVELGHLKSEVLTLPEFSREIVDESTRKFVADRISALIRDISFLEEVPEMIR